MIAQQADFVFELYRHRRDAAAIHQLTRSPLVHDRPE
jgi:hypothetical protein